MPQACRLNTYQQTPWGLMKPLAQSNGSQHRPHQRGHQNDAKATTLKKCCSCRISLCWHLQANISSAMVAVFDLERSWERTFLGTPHQPILTQIPTHILAFPNSWQPPMPPYGRIRSRTARFMWSLQQLSRSMPVSKISIFPGMAPV